MNRVTGLVLSAALLVVNLFGWSDHAVRAETEANSNKKVFPFPVRRDVLENGLTVMSVKYDSPGIVAYYTVVRTGSRNEVEPGLSGFAHFFEHMMFRGTPRFSEGKYNEVLKGLGADSNAFTTDDWTCYHITVSAEALDTVIELESDRFQNLSYSEPAFQKEARAVLGEYNKNASSPFLLLDEKMQDSAYAQHTYKHTTIGFLKDIEDMPNQYEYSLNFFKRWYRPDNCVVLVVGDVNHEHLVELTKKFYGSWQQGAAKIAIPQEPPQTEEKTLQLTWPGPTLPYLYIGYHVPAFDPKSRDIAALDVLGESLFSETSPLYQKLVLKEHKVEFIRGGAPFRRDASLFTIMARLTDEVHANSVRDEIYQALASASKSPIDAKRLADIKSHMRYAFAMGLDTPDAVASNLGEYLQLSGNAESVNEMYQTYDLVTASDLQRVAAKYFATTNRTAITLVSAATRPQSPEKGASNRPAARPTATDHRIVTAPLHSQSSSPFVQVAQQTKQPSRNREPARGERPPQKGDTIQLNAQSPLVALRLVLASGTKDDPPGKEGLAALTARVLVEAGTKRFSYNEILEKLYPISADVKIHADKEVTVMTGNVHRDKLAEFYDLFAETITSPRFDPDDFERIRQEQLNHVSKSLRGSNDEELGKWTLQLALYPKHPYGHVDAGTVAGLKAITLEDVKDFYRNHFSPASVPVQLGVAGGANEDFVKRLRKDFQSSAAGATESRALPAPHMPQDLEVTLVQKDCIATAISIGFPIALTRADDDFYSLAVANSALGEHRTFNGRLMKNMRGLRGLNYGDYSYIENFIQDGGSTFPIPGTPRHQQYFSIWIRPVPHDKALFALRQAVRELQMFVDDGLNEQEFQATRGFLRSYSKLWVQSQSRRLGYDMDGAFYGRASLVDELDRRLPDLTRDQVNAAIKKHVQANNLSIAIVTRDAAAFRDALLAGKPSPLKYDTAGTPEKILAEDKQIAVYPLKVNRERLQIVEATAMFEE